MPAESSFLPSWLRDLGSLSGLVAIGITIIKALFADRPTAFLERDKTDWSWSLDVLNPSDKSIVINKVRVFSTGDYFCTADSHNLYGNASLALRGFQNVIVGSEKKERFLICQRDRGVEPRRILVIVTWQSLAGIPWPRFPKILFRTGLQLTRLARAAKGTQGG